MINTKDMLLNWALYSRDAKIVPVSCRSLESNYKAPPMYDYPEPKAECDIKDAIKIEKALTSPTFPKFYMAIIVYNYAYPWLNHNAARRKINRFPSNVKVRFENGRNFEELLKKAENILENRLALS